jgi:hypothetical protein
MNTIPATPTAGSGRAGSRWRAILAAAAVAGPALLAAGCSGAPAHPAATSAASAGAGQVSSKNRGGNQGMSTTGGFSLAFARCMRAHGVPAFPDPNGHGGQLGPGSGIDPNAPPFQSAINGPCKSMAPPGWVGSGKVVAPGGGAS